MRRVFLVQLMAWFVYSMKTYLVGAAVGGAEHLPLFKVQSVHVDTDRGNFPSRCIPALLA
jgi:hypothetical protein